MTTMLNVCVPYSLSSDAVAQAPRQQDAQHIYLRLDLLEVPTVTGGSVWKASIPNFETVTCIASNKEGAVLLILEKLPEAYWAEVVKASRSTTSDPNG